MNTTQTQTGIDYSAMNLDQLYTEQQILIWQNNQLLMHMDAHNQKLDQIRRAIIAKSRVEAEALEGQGQP